MLRDILHMLLYSLVVGPVVVGGLVLLYSLLVRPKFEAWSGTIEGMSGYRPTSGGFRQYEEIYLGITGTTATHYFPRWLVSDYLHNNDLIRTGSQGTWFLGFLKYKPGDFTSKARVFAFHDGTTLHYAPLSALTLCPYGLFAKFAMWSIAILAICFGFFMFLSFRGSLGAALWGAFLCFVVLGLLWVYSVKFRANRARKILERCIIDNFPTALTARDNAKL